MKRLGISRAIELVFVFAGVFLLARSGWDLLRFAAFQRHAQWFAASFGHGTEGQESAPVSWARAQRTRPPTLRLIGKLEIPRLGASVLVVDGDDDESLSVAAGHVPGTALPGETGNSVIAGHRDTAFRVLHEVRIGDRIRVQNGRTYIYVVQKMRIVEPNDIAVVRSSGAAMLTMITCYPFQYVGAAPKRYVIQARLITETS
ncbi:MAG: class D sortase [Bryobacteraceae bacterium]